MAVKTRFPPRGSPHCSDAPGKDRLTPDLVFRDPYFLDFLGLTGAYSEADIEKAILSELETFILELGTDFAFVARQKRMTVDDEDYYLDLLFLVHTSMVVKSMAASTSQCDLRNVFQVVLLVSPQ